MSALEGAAQTVGGAGEARRMLTATTGESEGRGAEDGPGGAAASGGATSESTSGNSDAAGARGRHGSEIGKGLRACAKTRPASPLEWEAEMGAPRPQEW